jgi:8-oxo-dGTP pyrophosphatase MutT (NUDIX family)
MHESVSPSAPILRFHAIGQWSQQQVQVDHVPSTCESNSEIDQAVERAWQETNARPGVQLFDGPMCRLESWQAAPQRLRLALSPTSYKRFLGTNLSHPGLADRFGPQILANPVGVSPALLTADNFLMMGRRNASVAYYPNRIHPFAGALDPTDANSFAAVRRELREELSLDDADVPEIYLTGIAEDLSIRQPELIFLARTNRTCQEIEAALDRTEHNAAWSAPASASAIESALRSDDAFTPVAVASLLLYSRIGFGDAYFMQHAAPLAVAVTPVTPA